MKAPKLVKTKKSQLKVPVTTAGRKMQFYRNSNRSGLSVQKSGIFGSLVFFCQIKSIKTAFFELFSSHAEQKSKQNGPQIAIDIWFLAKSVAKLIRLGQPLKRRRPAAQLPYFRFLLFCWIILFLAQASSSPCSTFKKDLLE